MPAAPNTFRAIDLDPQSTSNLAFDKFVETVHKKAEDLKREQSGFSEGLRRANARWANGARALLALLGAIAFLLTGLATFMRFGQDLQLFAAFPDGDRPILLAVLLLYAVMGAIIGYEKATDKTTTYFRHVAAILAIRDLWTKFQFEFLKELMALKAAADPAAAEAAAREKLRTLAEAFCTDLNKASSGELSEFKTEFLASLSELEAATKKGSEDITAKLQEAATAAQAAAKDAKEAAEKAANEARAAARAAEDAAKPGTLNITVTGDFDDQVVIAIDGAERARSVGKMLAIEKVAPGLRTVSARAKKGPRDLEASVGIDVKPGAQDVRLTFA